MTDKLIERILDCLAIMLWKSSYSKHLHLTCIRKGITLTRLGGSTSSNFSLASI